MKRKGDICYTCPFFHFLVTFIGPEWRCDKQGNMWWYDSDQVPLQYTEVPEECARWLEYVVLGQQEEKP